MRTHSAAVGSVTHSVTSLGPQSGERQCEAMVTVPSGNTFFLHGTALPIGTPAIDPISGLASITKGAVLDHNENAFDLPSH